MKNLRLMKSKWRFLITIAYRSILCLWIITSLSSCDSTSGNKKEWKDPELVEVKDTDHSIQYYLAFNVQKVATGQPFTTNDLQASGRLLLTSGGNVKAMEFSDGYKKVYSFRCEPIGSGWYRVKCWLKSSISGDEYTYDCYTRERI